VVHRIVFPAAPRLHADYGRVQELVERVSALADSKDLLLVAVGSGVINDLVKRAASERGTPYLCVPTAASVDGFTAAGAALVKDGLKQTLSCEAPLALAVDPAVLAAAPPFLASSGIGDLAGKITAGSDWLIADLLNRSDAGGNPEADASLAKALGTEPIDEFCWKAIQEPLVDTLRCSLPALRGDKDAVAALFSALCVSGFCLQRLKSSRPASGCEHMMSHIWEMEHLEVDGVDVTHGHKVAYATLVVTAFTELLFASKTPPAMPRDYHRPSRAEREAEVRQSFQSFGVIACEGAVKTSLAKLIDAAILKRCMEAVRDQWGSLRDAVLGRLMPYGELAELLKAAQCPACPEDIALTPDRVLATIPRAQMIRNRYSAFDLAFDLGVLTKIISSLTI
jgi:glycerol-1-phosphate dehydrogenase [NAD(P)+]